MAARRLDIVVANDDEYPLRLATGMKIRVQSRRPPLLTAGYSGKVPLNKDNCPLRQQCLRAHILPVKAKSAAPKLNDPFGVEGKSPRTHVHIDDEVAACTAGKMSSSPSQTTSKEARLNKLSQLNTHLLES